MKSCSATRWLTLNLGSRRQLIFGCLALSVAAVAATPISAQDKRELSTCEMAAAKPLTLPPLAAFGTPGWDKQIVRAEQRAETFFACLEEQAVICNPHVACEPAPIPGFPAGIAFFIEQPVDPAVEPYEGCSAVNAGTECITFALACLLEGNRPVSVGQGTVLCCPGEDIPGAPSCP